MHRLPLLLLFCCTALRLFGGAPAGVQAREMELVGFFKSYTGASSFESALRDSLSKQFRRRLVELLQNESSLGYEFDSLRHYVSITQSADGRLRSFSWDEREGGSWRDMTCFAQFRGGDGKLHVQQLDTDRETETGDFSDVRIYSIHMVERNGRPAYLLLGSGTHGSGLHHSSARLLTIGRSHLEPCSDAFDGAAELVSEIPRTYPIDMRYDERRQVLVYNDYKWTDASSGKTRCLRVTELFLENGRFRKKA